MTPSPENSQAAAQAVEQVRDIIDAADEQLIIALGVISPSMNVDDHLPAMEKLSGELIERLASNGHPTVSKVICEDGQNVATAEYLVRVASQQLREFALAVSNADNDGDQSRAVSLLVRRNWLAAPVMAPYKHAADLDPAQDSRVKQQRLFRDEVIAKNGLEQRADAIRALFVRIGSTDADRYQQQYFARSAVQKNLADPDTWAS